MWLYAYKIIISGDLQNGKNTDIPMSHTENLLDD